MHVAVAVLMAWRVMLYCLTLEFFFRTALDASTTYVKDTTYPLLGAAVKGSASARGYDIRLLHFPANRTVRIVVLHA